MYSGKSAQRKVRNGCCATAPKRLGCVTAKPAPSIVTTMLANTSAYVRRTSVARSTPLRTPSVLTAGLYEKPMVSSDSVGDRREYIHGSQLKEPVWDSAPAAAQP